VNKRLLILALTILIVMLASVASQGQTPAASAPDLKAAQFAPLERWKLAILSGDRATLEKMFSVEPPAVVQAPEGDEDASNEVDFWVARHAAGLKAINLEVVGVGDERPDLWQIAFQPELLNDGKEKARSLYVIEGQMWAKQGADWKIVGVRRAALTKLQQPTSKGADLYGDSADAHAEIKQALARAKVGHKRLLVVFGADWCYDCHVLDKAFHRPDVAPTLDANFEVIHIDIGKGDLNQDLMKDYQVPMERGIPAIAVLDDAGSLLFSQKGGEFESARSLGPDDILAFLDKWKPSATKN